MRNRIVITILSVLVIVLAGTVAWMASRPPAVQPVDRAETSVDQRVEVTAAAVELQELTKTERFTGFVTPLHDVTAVSRVAGTVEWIVGDIGTPVKAGDPLVRIDDSDLRLQLKQAEAALTQAEASLERMRRGASDEERKQVEATVQQAEAGFQLAEESFRRAEFLYKEGAIPRDAFEQAESQYSMARSQLEAARQMLAQVERGASAEELRAMEAQVVQAQVAVEFAQKQLSDAVIKSPIDGNIALRHTQVGATVGAGTPVMTIVYMDEVIVQIGVSDRLVNALKPGDEVRVTIPALSNEDFTGKVQAVSPIADQQTRLFPVRIVVPNPDHRIKPGMVANVEVAVERTEPVPTVPQSAVVYRDGKALIYVIQPDGRVVERPVKLGLASGDRVQVDQAVPGERVVTSRHALLADGIRVVERGES